MVCIYNHQPGWDKLSDPEEDLSHMFQEKSGITWSGKEVVVGKSQQTKENTAV